ncbi:thiamine pyrophosphate-binding protein [Fodinisporobacter ferrooxydans]|uniref:Thiamine pyrophosphate-binding protein n=1 Tax=Fodinisporobacter ferrooxydans TaxID=2901836 RepID=A0ABY4CIT9_9BACL|nr:thiamine pyrophosphate-binding protein [Alicyclobacillaceae bacterium MYW30-H2]
MAKQKMLVAEAIVRFLEKKGVTQLYGIPGAAILPVFDAIREVSKITSYVVRHEQTAAFMADGYARATGQAGVCAVTSGPAGTNLLTGLYGAYMDSIPMIAMTGQVSTPMIGTMAFQEAPITDMARPVCKGVYLWNDAAKTEEWLVDMWNTATKGKKGPVLLDLPLNIQKQVIEIDIDAIAQEQPEQLPTPTEQEIDQVIALLQRAQKPALIVGGGVILSNATAELEEFVSLYELPVVTALMGIDAFPNDHPLFAGRMGTMCNTPLGNQTLLESDFILNVGGRFADRSVGTFEVFTANRTIVHVNLDKQELGKYFPIDLGIAADVKAFLYMMVDRAKASGKTVPSWEELEAKPTIAKLLADRKEMARKQDFDELPIKPQRALLELRKFLDRDAFVSHDCGISQIWSTQLFETFVPRTFLITGGAGTMGWGLGAAMAAKLAYPERQSVNIVGDGSLGMSLQDLATAAKHNIPVIVFLLNNSLLGLIRQQQNWYYAERAISTDLIYHNEEFGHDRGIDFVSTAKGMGVEAELVTHYDEIQGALERAAASGKPYLIEVLVDEKAVCSMSNNGSIAGVVETV